MAEWKHTHEYEAEGSPRTFRAICSRADTRPALPVEGIRPNLRMQFATQPTREASPTVISRADRVRASCWSAVHRLRSRSFSAFVKIERFSKTSISVSKIQTCCLFPAMTIFPMRRSRGVSRGFRLQRAPLPTRIGRKAHIGVVLEGLRIACTIRRLLPASGLSGTLRNTLCFPRFATFTPSKKHAGAPPAAPTHSRSQLLLALTSLDGVTVSILEGRPRRYGF